MPEKYYKLLITLAQKAAKKGEVPISAILVYQDKVIAKAYNTRKTKHQVYNHAEMLVIKKASRKLKDWRLDKCDMYVTLSPCKMCSDIINEARINNVYYLISAPKAIINNKYIQTNDCKEIFNKYMQIFNAFFTDLR